MDTTTWEEKRTKWKEEAEQRHARLAKLFHKDRFAFERERKRLIEEVINKAGRKEVREKLRALQSEWDRKMKGAGSSQNRFILAQTFFWEHFHEKWHPAIKAFDSQLNGPRTPQLKVVR